MRSYSFFLIMCSYLKNLQRYFAFLFEILCNNVLLAYLLQIKEGGILLRQLSLFNFADCKGPVL